MSQWYCVVSGTRYGPVGADQIQRWVAQGRLGPDDLVWREGMGEWQALSTVPELSAAMAQTPAPPTQPVQNVQIQVRPSNGLAVAGMVLGIIAVVLLCVWYVSMPCALLSLIFSIVGHGKAKEVGVGGGMAKAGLILSIIALSLALLIIILVAIGLAMLPWHDMERTSGSMLHAIDWLT